MPIDPPPAVLRFEDDHESLQISSIGELAALLARRGIRLVEEAVGRELPLAELLLAYTPVGSPYWTQRFALYPPGEFEARYGLPRDGGRPILSGTDLLFWTRRNAFEQQHLAGTNEIRWNLDSLVWQSRQLSPHP
jgi:hypothetical protein